MGNWQQKVRERLTACHLPRAIPDEVAFELASHLTEAYEEARASGCPTTPLSTWHSDRSATGGL
jgi:hypothetical protein